MWTVQTSISQQQSEQTCLSLIHYYYLHKCVRHKQLESILVVTQQFHETLEPLSEWLGATEKHLVHSEAIGTETSKLEDQISQHKVISIILPCVQSVMFSFIHFAHYFKFVLFIISHSVFH